MIDPVIIRHHLHEHPELSECESATHDYIVECLRECNPTEIHQHVGGYGVVAVWGNPTLAVRGDIDALPIGHRCGHDGHATILLRLAQLDINNVALIFQPAEEIGTGARAVIESGVLDRYPIHYIYGFHNIPGYPLGKVLMREGTFAMASTGMEITLKGRHTHASTPELGINPGLAVSELIPLVQPTLIFAHVGEEAYGTSAGYARMGFTLRKERTEQLDKLSADAVAHVERVAEKYHLQHSVRWVDPFPATVCDPEAYAMLKRVAEDPVMLEQPFRWSEDFGQYEGKTCFFGMGSGEDCRELHHPEYDFPDALIEPAAHFLSKLIKEINNIE